MESDLMQLWRQAHAHARSHGTLDHDAEDFASWCVVRRLKTGKFVYLTTAYKDWVREINGDERAKNSCKRPIEGFEYHVETQCPQGDGREWLFLAPSSAITAEEWWWLREFARGESLETLGERAGIGEAGMCRRLGKARKKLLRSLRTASSCASRGGGKRS